jgi:hypothetical protein
MVFVYILANKYYYIYRGGYIFPVYIFDVINVTILSKHMAKSKIV